MELMAQLASKTLNKSHEMDNEYVRMEDDWFCQWYIE